VVAVLALTAMLSGCSGDGSPEPTTPATVTVTETASVAPEGSETPSASETVTPTAETVTPSPGPDLTEPPRTYAEAIGHFAAAFAVNDIPQELSRFETPSGNIYCVLDDDAIPPSCEIGTGGVRDEAACIEAPSPTVGRIEFTERGAVPVCNSDTIRTAGPPVLGYGGVASWTGLSIQCLVEELGVTCVDVSTKQGFFLARGRYQVFG
jgi:hypothetical protein